MRRRRDTAAKVRADGDTWAVRLGERAPAPERRLVLFFCETTDQRPYRVVDVPAERIPDADALASLDEGALRELFAASSSMGTPRSYPTY